MFSNELSFRFLIVFRSSLTSWHKEFSRIFPQNLANVRAVARKPEIHPDRRKGK